MERVAAVSCGSYDTKEVAAALSEALDRIGFSFPEGKRVLIKPNIMSQNRPDQHTVTHFEVVEAICRLLSQKHCRIFIGESIAFYEEGLTERAFEISGIAEVAERYHATLVPFEKEKMVRHPIHSGLPQVQELFLPEILTQVDLVVNACKLKTHGSMQLSGAVKNLFGCLPGGYKQKLHLWTDNTYELSELFLDLHGIVKPALSVMDAVISLDGGPSALGKPVDTRLLLASVNAAALDVAACRILGFDPREVSILECARKREMLRSFEDVEIAGEIETHPFRKLVHGPLPKGTWKKGMFVTQTYVDLAIDGHHCSRCGICTEGCPVNAIGERDGALHIDQARCINCYYCLTQCPKQAVSVDATLQNRLMRVGRKAIGI